MTNPSIHGPWPVYAESDYPEAGAQRSSNVLDFTSKEGPAGTEEPLLKHSIRILCIKILLDREEASVRDCSEFSNLDWRLIAPRFEELRAVGLLEPAGIRFARAGFHKVFKLNLAHPAMDFILGPVPLGSIPPHVLLEKSVGTKESDSSGAAYRLSPAET